MNSRQTILIASSDCATWPALSKVLLAKGFEVIAADSEAATLVKAEEALPDIAVIDFGAVSGSDVVRQLKMHSPHTECILVTDRDASRQDAPAVEETAFLYVNKPFDPLQLLIVIRRAGEKGQAAQALGLAEEKLRALMDDIDHQIAIYDMQGTLLLINAAGARKRGSSPDALVGKTLQELHACAGDPTVDAIRQVVASRKARTFEFTTEHPSGRRHFVATCRPLCDLDGKLSAVQIVTSDVTTRRQLELMEARLTAVRKIAAQLLEKLPRDIPVEAQTLIKLLEL